MSRSLVCSIGEHASCDGNSPNGPAGVGNPCECSCRHPLTLTPAERDRERRRAQHRVRAALATQPSPERLRELVTTWRERRERRMSRQDEGYVWGEAADELEAALAASGDQGEER